MDDGEGGSGAPDAPSVASALLAGAALYNEGHVLAAHDPWEAAWLPLDPEADQPTDKPSDDTETVYETFDEMTDEASDERLLHGLIAFVAATHHARSRNWSGAVGCGENAVEYLGGLADRPRGVDIAPLRAWCRRLAADPETIERASVPPFRIDDVPVEFDALDLSAVLLVAPALAGAIDAGTESVFERAATLAHEECGTGRTTFAELLFAFCRKPETRPQVAARLADRVELADRKRRDVDDLF